MPGLWKSHIVYAQKPPSPPTPRAHSPLFENIVVALAAGIVGGFMGGLWVQASHWLWP